jgi:hypothetical protein
MKQLVDCIGMSARKKVIESGKKPRLLLSIDRASIETVRKELRFDVSSSSLDDHPPALESLQPSSESEESMLEGPPSPSPSPRPGSAMSLTLSMRPGSAMSMSRRSGTPTMTGSTIQRSNSGNGSRPSEELLNSAASRPNTSDIHTVKHAMDRRTRNQTRGEDNSEADLEEKHVVLMEDISYIETRLQDVWRQVYG